MKHSVIITTLSVVAIGIVLTILEVTNTTHLLHHASSATPTNTINYSPPTKTEKQDSEAHKDTGNQSTNTATGNTSSGSKNTVTVEITTFDPNVVSVNGFVAGVVEDGGTCTLTLTAKSDGKVVTSTHPGEPNASNTTCGETTIPISSLHSGTWQAILRYSSQTSSGKSDPLDITVK